MQFVFSGFDGDLGVCLELGLLVTWMGGDGVQYFVLLIYNHEADNPHRHPHSPAIPNVVQSPSR